MVVKRYPAQEDDIALADEAIGGTAEEMPVMDIEGTTPAANIAKTNYENNNFASTVARAVTGATPALMGLLFGASPLTAEDQIQQGQKFYANGTPKKLVMTKGPDGQPIYTDAREAVGEEAWTKPVATRPPGASGLQTVDLVSRDGTKSTKAIVNKMANTLTEVATGRQLSMDDWQPPVELSTYQKSKQLSGQDTVTPINKFGPTKPVALNQGLGQQYNLPEQEVQLGNKYAEKTAREMRPYIEGRATVKGALDLLENDPKNDNAIIQAAGIFRTAKLVVNERISDNEREFVQSAPGVLDNLANKIATGVTGAQRDSILTQMRHILIKLDKVQEDSAKAVQDTNIMAYSGGEKNKVKYLSDRIVNSIQPGTVNPITKQNKSNIEMPKFTKQQWDALSPQQRQREIDIIKNKKVSK